MKLNQSVSLLFYPFCKGKIVKFNEQQIKNQKIKNQKVIALLDSWAEKDLEKSIHSKELEFDKIFTSTYHGDMDSAQKIGRAWTLVAMLKEIMSEQKELDKIIVRNTQQTDIICSEYEKAQANQSQP